jgi:hypothetical protein
MYDGLYILYLKGIYSQFVTITLGERLGRMIVQLKVTWK